MGRIAKGFGAGSPILLANSYGLINPEYFNLLTPIEKILHDNHVLNRLIDGENEAYENQRKEAEEKRSMPGLKQRLSMEELIERQREQKERKGYA